MEAVSPFCAYSQEGYSSLTSDNIAARIVMFYLFLSPLSSRFSGPLLHAAEAAVLPTFSLLCSINITRFSATPHPHTRQIAAVQR